MTNITYFNLNAELNLFGEDGEIQIDKDKEAAKQFFLQHVNPNTVFFHSLEEKIHYMVEEGYWSKHTLSMYQDHQIKRLFARAYDKKFRFNTFVGAYKFYTSYALKTSDGERYLERYEDRVVMTALFLAEGDVTSAESILDEIIEGRYQPATPTFLNAGRANTGELVSCFLLRIEDNMESIGRSINSALQLSKRGGGVALLLSDIREEGSRIKKVDGASSGIIPVMKLLEDSFSYANQLGARQGAGAVYLNAHHPDIMRFLDTKRENADEKIRIKTLSLGVVIPDITFELARQGKDMYLFSPYDVERVYGKAFGDISITEMYDELVDNPEITKTKISARELFTTLAEVQFESGYPYVLFEDTANEANAIEGRINMSNLCSEVLQVNTPSEFNDDLSYEVIGKDISCNLGSMNVAKVMEDPFKLESTVFTAVSALTAVQQNTKIDSVPSIVRGNFANRSIGLGQMNLHGFFAQNGIHYDSAEAVDFTNVYFAAVRYHALTASMKLADPYGSFEGFDNSGYADGSALAHYAGESNLPVTDKVKKLFADVPLPTKEDWGELIDNIAEYGLYHAYLLAVPPTGNISYVNESTASIHPVTSPVEIRKEGKMGRVYYPAPGLSKETLPYYNDAYEIGYEAIIRVYAAATKHTDQGLSCTLFFKDTATTRDINKAQILAWRSGLKTLYYSRIRQDALLGTEISGCVSCSL